MGWARNGDAVCDNNCDEYPDRGSRVKTVASMRAAGWHHWDGVDMAGRAHRAILCPKCASPARGTKPARLEQETLEGM